MVISNLDGKILDNLHVTPTFEESFFSKSVVWYFHVRLQSTYIPNNLTNSTCSKIIPFILIRSE